MRSCFSFALIGWLVSLASPSFAGPCPDCPSGCVPDAYVQDYKEPLPELPFQCPAGCSSALAIKSMRDVPACEVVKPVEQKPKAIVELPPETPNVVSTQNRGVFMPTALSAPVKQVSFTGIGAGLWDIEYALSDNLQLGGFVTLPVGVMGVFPDFKAQFKLNDNISLGFGGLVGFGGVFAGDAGDYIFATAGHTELTFVFGQSTFNIGVAVAGAGFGSKDSAFEMAGDAVVLPNISYNYSFHRNWSLHIEAAAPILVDSKGVVNKEAIIVLVYGFRGHGDVLFGDVGFLMPFVKGYMQDVWKYTPLGIPYFSIGLKL